MEETGLISRQAVSSWLKQYGQDVLHGKYKFSLMYIWKNLMNLPSAQPEKRTNKRTETHACDCISRKAAIDAMTNTLWHYPNECYRNLNEYEFAKGLAELGLKSVPSAQPEVINGTLHITVDHDISNVYRVWLSQKGTYYGELYYPDYTDEEIQKMQDLAQAQLDKAYELRRQSAQPEQQWIPVSERLPEDDTLMLVNYIDNRPDAMDIWIGWHEMENVWYIDGEAHSREYGNEVVAWMPLPEPYKERREE